MNTRPVHPRLRLDPGPRFAFARTELLFGAVWTLRRGDFLYCAHADYRDPDWRAAAARELHAVRRRSQGNC